MESPWNSVPQNARLAIASIGYITISIPQYLVEPLMTAAANGYIKEATSTYEGEEVYTEGKAVQVRVGYYPTSKAKKREELQEQMNKLSQEMANL